LERESEPLRDPDCESLVDVESESLSDREPLRDSESLADDAWDPLGSLTDPEPELLCDVESEPLLESETLVESLADSEKLPEPE
jgi:hypothetical protein